MKKLPNKLPAFTRMFKKKSFRGLKNISLLRYRAGWRLQSSCFLRYQQVENSRRILSKFIKGSVKRRNIKHAKNLSSKKGFRKSKKSSKHTQIFIKYAPRMSLTKKPLQVRMGKGKGSIVDWVQPTKSSTILLEISNQKPLRKLYKQLKKASLKLPSKGRFVYTRRFLRRETQYKLHTFISNNH
jgi:ribosomal protein L16/L10AE